MARMAFVGGHASEVDGVLCICAKLDEKGTSVNVFNVGSNRELNGETRRWEGTSLEIPCSQVQGNELVTGVLC